MSTLGDILASLGGDISQEALSDIARTLPPGYVLTFTYAGEAGLTGVFGVEGSIRETVP